MPTEPNEIDVVERYQRDGAVVLRQLLSQKWLELLHQGVELNLATPSERGIRASLPGDGEFFEDFCCWQFNPFYRQIIFESELGVVASQLTRSSQIRLYHDHLLVKRLGTRQATPWHQDQPYYNIAGEQNVSFWIPLDPVARTRTLEFVAGSHQGPWLLPRTFLDRRAKWFPQGTLAEVPDIESRRDDYPIVGWALEPGDVVAFHMGTLHAAPGLDDATPRRVLSVRMIGDDIVHAPRPWKTSPHFPQLNEQLAEGAAMDHELFPVIYPKSA